MTDTHPWGRGYSTWREYVAEEPPVELTNRLLAELVDTLDDIRNELNEMNSRGRSES